MRRKADVVSMIDPRGCLAWKEYSMSVVTERVKSDETDPPFFLCLLISFLSFSLTTRISVAFIENSVQFIGQRSSELKVGHTCKRRENSGRRFETRSVVLCTSLKAFPTLVCGIALVIISAKQTTKGERQKERDTLFPVTTIAINPSLIEPNSHSVPFDWREQNYQRDCPLFIEQFPFSR